MKKVSIQELKRRLSTVVSRAEEGEAILITRHRQPVAKLTSAEHAHLHRGVRCGEDDLVPVLRNATRGRYLEILVDDRRGAEDA